MCLELKVQRVKYAWVTEDVRNQVGNCRWKFTAFKIKDKVFVIYLKIESCNETMDQEFSDLKARSNVAMKQFKDKMTGVCYFLVSKGLSRTCTDHQAASKVMLIFLEVRHHVCKFQRWGKKVKRWKYYASRLFRF